MIYLDTSVLVSALTNESATVTSQAWLKKQNANDLAVSDWTTTEFSAALSIKVRMGEMPGKERASVLRRFARVSARSFVVLAVARSDFQNAARLCQRAASGLRASDALHLAIAEHNGLDLCTLDARLAKAAEAIGVRVIRPA
jgi:predicted nucleic acid-binding protein